MTRVRRLSSAGLTATRAAPQPYDVLVHGSTPGGLAAALEAARRGLRVVLICPKRYPGGMTASGLSTPDAVRTEGLAVWSPSSLGGFESMMRIG